MGKCRHKYAPASLNGPYVECVNCGETRNAVTGQTVEEGSTDE